MAYSLRAWYEHESIFGVVDRIELYEDGFGGTDIELEGKGKAFKFEHREITSEGSGGILSVHDNQIMMGVLDFFPLIGNATKKTLIQDISDAGPFDFQVRLVRDGTTVWYGYPSGRVFSYPERPSYFATLQFKDFEVLQTQDFPLEDNRQHIITTLADLFSYTNTSQSIYTVTSFQEENTTLSDDFLNQVYHDTVGLREYGGSGDEADTPITVYDALIHASEAVLLIKQWDGFRIDQLSGYADPSAVLQSEYNESGVQQSSTTVDVRQTINASAESSRPWMKVTSDNDTYPSVHKAKVFFNHRTSESGIQVPSIVSLEESTAETGLITASTGSTNVSGSGTSFLSDVSEGDTLWVPQLGELRELGEVASVTDNTNIILTTQANYTVTDSEWHIDAEETGRYSQEFSSDGTQRIRLATTVRVTGNFGTTQIYGRYRIQSGSYWYNKTTDGWTNSGEVINEFRARGTTSEVSGSIALETSNIPDAADGTLELTLFIAEDQNDSSANVDVTTYEDTTFTIRENTAAGNSNGTEHELTQTGGFDTYDFGEDWYGDGVLGAVYLPANYRHGTGTTDVTEDSWRRRGETTYIGFHELKLREVIDFQRSRTRKIYGEAWGEIDPNKVGVYQSNNYYYAGGVYDGRWRPRYMRINQQTSSSDDYVSRIRLSGSGGGGGSSSTVGSGGLTESEADGLYFRQNELLSEASDLPTLYGNIGLDDGSADLDFNSLDIGGDSFVDSSRNVSAGTLSASGSITGGYGIETTSGGAIFKRNSSVFFDLQVPSSGQSTDRFRFSWDGQQARLRNVDDAGNIEFNLLSGDNSTGSNGYRQQTFDFVNIGFSHGIATRHNGSGDADNAIDFYLWQSSQARSDTGNYNILSLDQTGSELFSGLSISDTLTINSQLLFTAGNEQQLSTDASPTFAGLSVNETDTTFFTQLSGDNQGGASTALALRNPYTDNNTSTWLRMTNSTAADTTSGRVDLRATRTNDPSNGRSHLDIWADTSLTSGFSNQLRIGNNGLEIRQLQIGSPGSATIAIDTSRNAFFVEGTFSGDVEVGDDLTIGGALMAEEFIVEQYRSLTNFQMTPAGGRVESVTGSAGSETVTLEDPRGNTANPFQADDIVLIKFLDTDAAILKEIYRKVASVSGVDVTFTTTGITWGTGDDVGSVEAGDFLVATGSTSSTTRDHFIRFDITGLDTPAIRFFDSVTDVDDDGDEIIRIGEVNGVGGVSSSEIGFFAGNYDSGNGNFILATENQLTLQAESFLLETNDTIFSSTTGLEFEVGGGADAGSAKTIKWLDSGSLRAGIFTTSQGALSLVGYDGSNPVVGAFIDDEFSTSLPFRSTSGEVHLNNLPTSDPSSPGQLWNDSGTVKVSTTSPPSVPSAPTGLALCSQSSPGGDYLELSWNTATGADVYDIFRGTSTGNLSYYATTSITSYDDDNAGQESNKATEYFYHVKARNTSGSSSASSEVSDSYNSATAC